MLESLVFQALEHPSPLPRWPAISCPGQDDDLRGRPTHATSTAPATKLPKTHELADRHVPIFKHHPKGQNNYSNKIVRLIVTIKIKIIIVMIASGLPTYGLYDGKEVSLQDDHGGDAVLLCGSQLVAEPKVCTSMDCRP